MVEKKIVEFDGTMVRSIFDSENFKIYGFSVDYYKHPNIRQNKYSNVTVLGNTHTLDEGVEYHVKAEEKQGREGTEYKVISIKRDKPKTDFSVRLFLNEILESESQVNEIMKSYPDIIDRVINNRLDDIDLKKLYNIGEFRFNVIKRKIVENFALAELVDDFKGFIEFKILKVLLDKYLSIENIKEKLQDNPYMCLCNLSRIAFKTADKILIEFNKECISMKLRGEKPPIDLTYDLLTSSQRQKAAIIFLLEENENNGNTKIDIKELRKQSEAIANKCIEHFVDIVKNDEDIHFDKMSMTVALQETFETEQYIANRILEGISVESKWDIDTTKYKTNCDITLTDQQHSVLHMVCSNSISILNGFGGCVDCDTEFFNGYEWKKISEYKNNDKVLQYNEDGTAELVNPIEYHKYTEEYLWQFETKYGLNQCLSDEHNVYYITSKNNLYHKTFKEVRENQEKTNGFLGKFITTFNYKNNIHSDYNEWDLRLKVAIKADGSFKSKNTQNICYMNLKKKRKQDRIELLLNKNGIPYDICYKKNGFKSYKFYFYDNSKTYTQDWYNLSKMEFEIIFDEVFYWDGNYKYKNQFYSTIKSDADYMQFVGTSLGYRSSINKMDRRGRIRTVKNIEYITKSIDYVVIYSKRRLIGLCTDNRIEKTPIHKYKTLDGYKYCFTTESGMLVLRRNDCIFITGNSGKTATTKSIIDMLNDNKKAFVLLSPTGRAAKVLSEYTKQPASTIHRGLAYMPPDWGYNEKNPLNCDVVIVDESSMIDVFLMRRLIEALDFNKTKLLLIGDSAQIPSVGAGNVFYDLINSKKIPIVSLTQIFRYGKGGQLTIATKTRESERWLTDSKEPQIFGEDKGYMFIPTQQEKLINKLLALYKKLLDSGINTEDIMILSAFNKGEYGTVNLNKSLQPLANPNINSSSKYMDLGYNKFYENDLVIQTVNNYKAKPYIRDIFDYEGDDEKVFIPNGEIGKIIEIQYNNVIIKFSNDIVIYTRDNMQNVKLAYSISIHRAQGGQCRTVILITPKAHTYMLNSNLIYVGQTRAKEKVYHFGEVETVNRAIKKKADFTRNTFLKDILTN